MADKETFNSVFDYLVYQLDLDVEGAANLRRFVDTVKFIESSGGTNLANPDSSARGSFQFMTTDPGKGQNAWFTGLNRTKKTYKFSGQSPDWIESARKRNDPRVESDARQEDVFLSNIWQQPGTSKLFRKVAMGGPGAREAAFGLYADKHHTRGREDEDTRRVARKAFGFPEEGGYYRGGLIRDPYGRTLI